MIGLKEAARHNERRQLEMVEQTTLPSLCMKEGCALMDDESTKDEV